MGQKNGDPHQRLESLERWSARATLWILAGIVIDFAVVLWFDHSFWERTWGILANVLIGVGLAVEYVVIGRAIIAGREAQRLSDEKVAAAEDRAAQAHAQASGSAAIAADAQRRIAQANRKAAEAELELEKLRREVAPRILSNEQQENLVRQLMPFGRQVIEYGKQTVVLISYGMDTEAAVLGSQLLSIFERVGIRVVNRLASELPLGSFAVGVHIAGSNDRLAFALAEGIGEIGDIEVTLGTKVPSINPETSGPEVAAAILIGTRPVRIAK